TAITTSSSISVNPRCRQALLIAPLLPACTGLTSLFPPEESFSCIRSGEGTTEFGPDGGMSGSSGRRTALVGGTLLESDQPDRAMRATESPWILLLRFAALLAVCGSEAAAAYTLAPDHPRIFITRAGLPDLARRCAGPLADDYHAVKSAADAAVMHG